LICRANVIAGNRLCPARAANGQPRWGTTKLEATTVRDNSAELRY
jgi:hypothetical protein